MKKFSTYLLVMFMIVFWIIRIIITITSQLGKDFLGMVPMNNTFEIVILFATLLCIVLIVKRKMLGSLLYLTLHAIYFGGDITNKLNNRREYRDFVLSQTNLNKKNIERYRQILKVRKHESLDSKVIKNINNFMDICFDVNMELQDLDNDILTNKKFDEFKLVSYWNQVNCDGIYASMIRQTYGSDTSLLFTTRERRPYGRGHYDQLVFSFKSIADCLIILNLKVQRCIDLSISVREQYQKYIDIKNKSDVSHEVIAQEIDSLKLRFTSLRTFVEQDYSNVYQSAKNLLEKNGFNITNITDKIDNFKFNI